MHSRYETTQPETRYSVEDHFAEVPPHEVIATIWAGLNDTPKRIPSIYFYDSVGSKLFEEITALPEYYPTRTEKKLLDECAAAMADEIAGRDIVEIGSGDCSKITRILRAIPEEHIPSLRYIPVDVSRSAIDESARLLLERFPGLRVHGVVADFITQLDEIPRRRARCILFLGSTVGNLSRRRMRQYMTSLGATMRPGETFLLGTDRVKDRTVLEAAYNDSRGVTAAFNRNILNVVNRRAGTDFDPASFDHVALYNDELMRIEMYLWATRDMVIRSPRFPDDIAIMRGELIHTENSHKFTRQAIRDLARAAGLRIEGFYEDPAEFFSLVRMTKTEEEIQ